MTPEQAVDREAIRYTLALYNTEGDRGKTDALAEAFTEDGVLHIDDSGTEFTGRAAISAGLSTAITWDGADAEPPLLRHNLTTSRIEFDGPDTARAWTYFFVITRAGVDHMGRYIDRFVRSGSSWLIAHRRVKVEWRSPASLVRGENR